MAKTQSKRELEDEDVDRFESEGGHDRDAAKQQAKREEKFVKEHKIAPKPDAAS